MHGETKSMLAQLAAFAFLSAATVWVAVDMARVLATRMVPAIYRAFDAMIGVF